MIKKPIKYSVHIPIVLGLIILQFYSSEIFSFFYLRAVEKELVKLTPLKGHYYKSGEYIPLLKKDPYSKIPKDYKYAFVKENGHSIKEIYYSRHGEITEVFYINGEIQEISGKSYPSLIFFILPVVGFLMCFFAIFHEIYRTGEIRSWRLGRNPDRIEKVLYLYGVPLFATGLIFGVIKQLGSVKYLV